MNGAELICETLLANGIDVCFANPGTSEMHFVAALDKKTEMRCILGLFEGVVTGAADGYARMAEKPAATLLHLGSGLANGAANLHNAKRARTPMVNIVGDHARHHLEFDAPLTSDIAAVASAVSDQVITVASPDSITQDIRKGIQAAFQPDPGVSTIILPADVAWTDVPADTTPSPLPFVAAPKVDDASIAQAAAALTQGNAVLFLGGHALSAACLVKAHSVAVRTGATLLAETSNRRMRRGRGSPAVAKLPYPVDAAIEYLEPVKQLVLLGARTPVAFFAYPGKPSKLVPETCHQTLLAMPHHDIEDALNRLMQYLDLRDLSPVQNQEKPDLPPESSAPLTGDNVCRAIAALLPDEAIVVDEGVTQGRSFFNHSYGSAPHDYLQLTGGAIGIGLPLATGAAVACPTRHIISLQADGSGMYTVQALWTQARERLNCLTIIFSNRRYGILHGEMANVGVTQLGPNATNMLSLENPDIGWTQLASGMGVTAVRTECMSEFIAAFKQGLSHNGPFLIEAVL